MQVVYQIQYIKAVRSTEWNITLTHSTAVGIYI